MFKHSFCLIVSFWIFFSCQPKVVFDVAINGARVIDPETHLDTIINIGILGDTIATVDFSVLTGVQTIDGSGLVLTPGFIDMHTHSPTSLGTHFALKDGVTTALELEAGAFPVREYGGLIKNESVNHFGASVGYIMIRTQVMEDGRKIIAFASEQGPMKPGLAFVKKAKIDEIEQIRDLIVQGIQDGGIGIGLPLDYISEAVTDEELDMIFEVAAKYQSMIITHIRRGVQGDPAGLIEMIERSKKYKVPVHICHINANAMGAIDRWFGLIAEANENGADLSYEMYPYPAGSTAIGAAVFRRDWKNIFGITYEDVQWSATGEYLTQESFEKYQKEEPTGIVIHHYGKEEWLERGIVDSDMIIATDAIPIFNLSEKVTPRGIGTYSKILRKYIRESELLTLKDAVAKMTYAPAKRLEIVAPIFKKKGRIQIGAHADLVLFNPSTISDHATYEKPYEMSTGIEHIWVMGQQVIRSGAFVDDQFPGMHLFAN